MGTSEKGAWDEALELLQQAAEEKKEYVILKESNCLKSAADDHGKDMCDNKFFSHTGSDGSSPWDRISNYCTWKGGCSENIAVGQSDPFVVTC